MSSLLYLIVLLFGGLFILFPIIMFTMALWALVSFDTLDEPDMSAEEFASSFDAFQSHPMFFLCVFVFAIGIAGLVALMMRGAAYAAASVAERRIVAMEAFNWTRGSSLRLMAFGGLILIPIAVANIGISQASQHLQPQSAPVIMLAGFLTGVVLWLSKLTALALSAEVYRQFRSSASVSSQPSPD